MIKILSFRAYCTSRTQCAMIEGERRPNSWEVIPCSGGDDKSWLDNMANWTSPRYSRNQVDKAGDILIGDVDGELTWAFPVVNNWRDAHNFPLAKLRMQLKRLAKKVVPGGSARDGDQVVARIKRMPSIKSKLQRQTTQLSQMQDVGGCRAVLKSIGEVRELVDLYKDGKIGHIFRGEKNYIDGPKREGYRCHHLIYGFQAAGDQAAPFNGLRIEVQIRTDLQHIWATAVEAVGLFTNQALKSNTGNPEWLRLFALMGSEVAQIEGTPLVPNTPTQRFDRIIELRDLVAKLHAIKTLELAREALNWAERIERQWLNRHPYKYFLIQYDFEISKVSVDAFLPERAREAHLAYTQAEQSAKAESRNIVLVSANSMRAVQRGYPNYFLDTKEFTKLLIGTLK